MKKLLGIVVLGLLWCNLVLSEDKKIKFKLDVNSSVGQKHLWIFYEDNTCGEEGYLQSLAPGSKMEARLYGMLIEDTI